MLSRRLLLLTRPLFSLVERWTIRRADKVNLVSRGFKSYFDSRYPSLPCSFFTNGIDEEFIAEGARQKGSKPAHSILTVLYAGNMGEGQGLHMIVPALAKRMRGRIIFRLIGDGGRTAALQTALQKAGVDNVYLLSPMKRDQLIQAYQEADVLFLHLNDYEAFKRYFHQSCLNMRRWESRSGPGCRDMRRTL